VTVDLAADVVTDLHELYVQLRELSVRPEQQALPPVADALGTWWKLPKAGSLNAQALSPDPAFVRAQTDVLRFQEDLGNEPVGGRDAYHYLVSIDTERLVGLMKTAAEQRGEAFDAEGTRSALDRYDAQGEVWIDTETYHLHRVHWTISSTDASRPVTLELDVGLTNHNAAGPSAPPSAARETSLDALRPLFELTGLTLP
jgi:hypothetical protein